MARLRQFDIVQGIEDIGSNTPSTLDADGIAQAQTTAGAANLMLDGVAVVDGIYNAGFSGGRLITLTSTGNLSALTFTVDGFDKDNAIQSETISGPNNNTVTGTKYFNSVTQVSVDGEAATAVTCGFSSSLVVLNVSSLSHFVLSPANAEIYKIAIYGGSEQSNKASLRINNPATWTVTWADGTTPSDTRIYFPAGVEPTLTASSMDWFDFTYDGNFVSGDAVWYCVNSAQDLKP